MWLQWLAIALLGAVIVIRVIVNRRDRPSDPTNNNAGNHH
jgi:hypothetical protein